MIFNNEIIWQLFREKRKVDHFKDMFSIYIRVLKIPQALQDIKYKVGTKWDGKISVFGGLVLECLIMLEQWENCDIDPLRQKI